MSSQVVEVAIGLSVTFFFVALIASGVVESLAKVLKKRATDLEGAIEHLLGGHDVVSELKTTSVYRALQGGSAGGDASKAKAAKPSYMSARAFADATIEMIAKTKARSATDAAAAENLVNAIKAGPLGDRLVAIESDVGADLRAAKAKLESWFDDTMERLQGAYSRWAKLWLAATGLVLAVILNVSATTLTARLWDEPVIRQSVVASATRVTTDTSTGPTVAKDLGALAAQIKQVDSLKLPIGWEKSRPNSAAGWIILALGWLLTGFATMLGAPFWFDLLRRLTTMTGMRPDAKPLPASQDPQAASYALANASIRASTPVVQPAGVDVFGTTFVPTRPRPEMNPKKAP